MLARMGHQAENNMEHEMELGSHVLQGSGMLGILKYYCYIIHIHERQYVELYVDITSVSLPRCLKALGYRQ